MTPGHASALLCAVGCFVVELRPLEENCKDLKKKKSVPCLRALFPEFRFLLVPWLLSALEDNSR